MGDLLDLVVDQQNLLTAWGSMQSRLADEPVPSVEHESFAADLLANLAGIREQLAALSWQPGPARQAQIPKSGGGIRTLRIPSLSDRVAERAIATVLSTRVDPHLQPDSYGYRPGLGVEHAVAAVQERIDEGDLWVVRADIADCFESVSRRGCLRALADLIDDPDVLLLVGRVLDRPGNPPGGVGLPQGSPLSPLLVNLYLDGLDRELWVEGINIIRYADDIAITAVTQDDARRYRDTLAELLTRRGLRIAIGKNKIQHAGQVVTFLGRELRADGRTRQPTMADPSRATLYVVSRGSAVRARGTKFLFTKPGKPTMRHAAARTRAIVCTDRVLLTSGALALAAANHVEISLMDTRGALTGVFTTGTDRYQIRAAQQRTRENSVRTLELARAIVTGKILNSRVLLTRNPARRAAVPTDLLSRLDRLAEQARVADAVPALLGIEGAASAQYFRALSTILPKAWNFSGRNRRPPRDPVNAMLSYAYTILTSEARRAAELAGLDPTTGFLHQPHRGRPSLALDLIEEFRALIADTTVLRLIGTKAVTLDDFTHRAGAGCMMSMPARRALITELERRLLTQINHPLVGRRMSYREAIQQQAIAISHVCGGSRSTYHPMPWR